MVDYGFYTSVYGGDKIPFETFDCIEKKAQIYLDRFTYGRVYEHTTDTDKVRMCLCNMCDAIYEANINDGKEKKSENTDGYSVTYVTESLDGQDSNVLLNKKLCNIADLYLCGTGLLYCGL